MALVSEACYMKWFQKDHWMYRQFSYIFSNPLWNKPVPGGFSLCPYFWMSILLGFILLRLFLVPLLLVTGWIVKNTVGAAESALRRRLKERLEPYELGPVSDALDLPGAFLLFTASVFSIYAACASVGAGVGWCLYETFEMGWEYGVALLLLCILLPVIIITERHKKKHAHEEKRCRVEVYQWIFGVVTLVWGAWALRAFLWRELIVKGIWEMVVCFVLKGAAVGIWSAICWCGSGIWSLLSASPDGIWLPYSVMIAAGWLVLVYLAGRWLKTVDTAPPVAPALPPQMATEDDVVRLLFAFCVHTDAPRLHLEYWLDSFDFFKWDCAGIVRRAHERYIFERYIKGSRRIMERIRDIGMTKREYHGALNSLTSAKRLNWDKDSSLPVQLRAVSRQSALAIVDLRCDYVRMLADDPESQLPRLKEWTKEFERENAEMIETFRLLQQRRDESDKKWKEWCKRVTGALHTVFCKPFILIWRAFCTVLGFLWNVVCYFRDVWKARKQGWCPYVTFRESAE